jgi:uncharacterized protein with HEPN domain
MIHDYSGIDFITVWEIIHEELPHLKQQLETLIANITNA